MDGSLDFFDQKLASHPLMCVGRWWFYMHTLAETTV
jgi:hypothetical protein